MVFWRWQGVFSAQCMLWKFDSMRKQLAFPVDLPKALSEGVYLPRGENVSRRVWGHEFCLAKMGWNQGPLRRTVAAQEGLFGVGGHMDHGHHRRE